MTIEIGKDYVSLVICVICAKIGLFDGLYINDDTEQCSSSTVMTFILSEIDTLFDESCNQFLMYI